MLLYNLIVMLYCWIR